MNYFGFEWWFFIFIVGGCMTLSIMIYYFFIDKETRIFFNNEVRK